MIKILNFQITLLKERFSIKKWYNILSVILIVLAVFVGYRFAFVAIGNYNNIALIISTFMYCFIFRTIFPKQVESKCNTVRIFFPKINVDKYRTFQYHYKYVIYEIILCYSILPYNIENYPFFVFILAILHIFMFCVVTVKRYLKASSYNFIMTATIFFVCLLTLLYSKNIITIPNFLFNNIWFFSGCILLTLILSIQIYRYLTPVVGFTSSVLYINKTKNNKLLSKNKDLLYTIRTNKFIEPIIIILISATISKYLQEHISDMIFTNLFSFSYAYIYIYTELLKSERKTFPLIYCGYSIGNFKKEKICNTLKITIPIILITIVPTILLTSIISVVVALLLSTILFIINSAFFKISLEKGKGYNKIISEKEHVIMILLDCLEIILIYNILDFIL